MNTTRIDHTDAGKRDKTHQVSVLQAMLQSEGMDLPHEAEWIELADHIDVHKYLINQHIGWTISWDDAVFSWYENVYRPMRRAIETWEVRRAFADKTTGQLYLAVTTHWHYLKQRDQRIGPEEAARDFAAHYGSGLASWFSRFL